MNENNNKNEEVIIKKPKKNKRTLIILIIVLVLIALLTVTYILLNNKSKTIDKDVINVSDYKMKGNNVENFDLSFLKIENNEKNLVYSPLSIKYALEMLSEGAAGTSKSQIDNLLGSYSANKYVNSNHLSFANALFIKNSFKDGILPTYIQNLSDKYNAEVKYDSFETGDNINSWVSDKTFGLIKKLVDDTRTRDKDFYLINALAIDMEWNNLIQNTLEVGEEYNVSYNHEKYGDYIPSLYDDYIGTLKFNNNTLNSKGLDFGASINNYDIVKTLGEENVRATVKAAYEKYISEEEACYDETISVDQYVDQYIKEIDSNYQKLETSTDFSFYVDDDLKVFAKDLKTYNNTTLQYVAIMPVKVSLKDYINNLKADDLTKAIDNLKTVELKNFEEGKITKIVGGIPVFKYDYQLDFQNDLQKLGITNVFDPDKADLSKLTNIDGTYIDEALHKATIEFSNEGIKAAAASAIGGLGAEDCGFVYDYEVPVVEIDVTIDNPYLYLIRDKATGEVWFMGTVYEPTEIDTENTYIINRK